MDQYNAGLLGGDESWSPGQWHDYIRSELESAHDFYVAQWDDAMSDWQKANAGVRDMLERAREKCSGALDDIEDELID